jgi:hypothetical protein
MWSHFAARRYFAVGDDDRDELQREQPLDRRFEFAFRQCRETELRRPRI